MDKVEDAASNQLDKSAQPGDSVEGKADESVNSGMSSLHHIHPNTPHPKQHMKVELRANDVA